MNNANKCPRCKKFILGTYCATCKEDITKMAERIFPTDNDFGNFFNDFFSKGKDE